MISLLELHLIGQSSLTDLSQSRKCEDKMLQGIMQAGKILPSKNAEHIKRHDEILPEMAETAVY